MRRVAMLLLAIVGLSGCMLVSTPGFQQLSQLTGTSGSAFSEFGGTESTVEVNKSWIDINKLQTKYTRLQMKNIESQNRAASIRQATTLGILRDVEAAEGGNPNIADMILYVQNGGDPQFALNYALRSEQEYRHERELRHITLVLLEQMAARPDADSNLRYLTAWVEAGGDPELALNYALNHQRSQNNPATLSAVP